jgi:virulence factor Mce-like protein
MNRGSSAGGAFTNPVLVGASIVIAIVIGVFLSYNANKGLPFVKTYKLNARVPDAAELVVGDEVRIGGFRVGQVNKITAEPARKNRPPYASLQLALNGSIKGIPADTLVRVRPRSLLGSKYLELEPGDGRELKTGSTLPLKNARSETELDEAFNVFDPDTRKGLQGTIRGLGDATAGRGGDLNRSLAALNRLLPPLQHVSQNLAAPDTDLKGFINGLGSTMAALRPVSDDLDQLMRNASTTFRALNEVGPAFERGIAALPGTFAQGQVTLRDVAPVASDLAGITVALRKGTVRLPETADKLSTALAAGTQTLPRTQELTRPLQQTLDQLDEIAKDARAPRAAARLAETVNLLQPTLTDLQTAQIHCNVGGLWARNSAGAVSHGDQLGTWLAFVPIIRTLQTQHSAEPDPDLHVNTQPTLNGTECESGNETYLPGQAIGHPPGTQPSHTEETTPPADATDAARNAGLLTPIPGASR